MYASLKNYRQSNGFEFNLKLTCTSEFFKKLKLHQPLRANYSKLFETEREKPYENLRGGSTGILFLKPLFSHSRKRFSKFPHKSFVIILRNVNCLSTNHDAELRGVICTGVTFFAPVLHLSCTGLSQSESSNFFMYIIIPVSITREMYGDLGPVAQGVYFTTHQINR